MAAIQRKLSTTFRKFFDSEKAGGILLILCTILSLLVANSPLGKDYLHLWHVHVARLSIEHWISDALMAVFFTAELSGA